MSFPWNVQDPALLSRVPDISHSLRDRRSQRGGSVLRLVSASWVQDRQISLSQSRNRDEANGSYLSRHYRISTVTANGLHWSVRHEDRRPLTGNCRLFWVEIKSGRRLAITRIDKTGGQAEDA
jgi:hypothetical protein